MTSFSGETYQVDFDEAEGRIAIAGVLRLNGMAEYGPIVSLLANAAEANSSLTLDLSALEFLNSSGIAVLSKFIIEIRNRGGLDLSVIGSRTVPWQGKSLQNLKRLMPALTLTFE